ncbi:MAG: glycoside hydrolase family 31 protein [Coriobacteriaceae bacterium]|nr:glycoside hydrolase family 31 protein [Coriobacteriaceae bacterium]
MHQDSILKRNWVRGSAVLATAALSLVLATPAQAAPLTGVKDATADKNVVTVTFNQGDKEVKGKITFLEEDIFRYNVDPSGEFSPYAKPKNEAHKAKIQAQPDTSEKYSKPTAAVDKSGDKIVITAGKTTIEFAKDTAIMTVKRGDKIVMQEKAALDLDKSATVQTLVKHDGEDFFGGGTQNGRFIHTGNTINIANESNWVDGGVASPNPFYWSDGGYGVVRNTFANGKYDFGATAGDTTVATHNENELDAYYFVADAASGKSTAPIAQDLLQDYFKVTGSPVLLPEYAFYVGSLNAWNRDMWSKDPQQGYGKRQMKGSEPAETGVGDVKYEKGGTGTAMQPNTHVESLNGHGPTDDKKNIPEGVDFPKEFSAQTHLNSYLENDMPLGYFLPNDGYGAGYGQNGFGKTGGVDSQGNSSAERLAAVAANVENLKEFTEYARSKGVETGLWTQSQLSPDKNPDTQWQLLRDFDAEVKKGGVTTLKTDVAWVGHGYSMALDGVKTAYDTITEGVNYRPNIISLDGWAGTQRFAGIWTGDQTGGNWEYIRFHIPTYIGQSLSGNPNIGSDMDGIFGGNPVIATRDYQWKTFTPLMLDMDGWGSYVKAPQTHGDPYTGISRMYLKLKSSLMPYLYTTAASAANINTGNGDTGLPMVRAIMLSDDSAYAQSTKTQYEFTFGDAFLIAPVYQNTDGSADNGGIGDGNDVRNGIYLPGTEEDIWIDYFSGKQYRGGQVLNNFDTPLWKLPLFVKANAIVPMYEPNDNPKDIDRTKRNVEFFATEGKGEYTLFEDTGTYIKNTTDSSDAAYGKESKSIDYGSSVKTKFTSNVKGDTATFKAGKSEGTYDNYDSNRTTVFTVNVSKEPQSVVAKNGDQTLTVEKVDSLDAFKKAVPAEGKAVYFFEQTPNLNYGATAESEKVRAEGFSKQAINTTPKLHVKFAKTDVNVNAQTLEVKGFENKGDLDGNKLDASLKAPTNLTAPEDGLTPTSIKLTWDKVEGAASYDIEIDGMINNIPSGETVEFNATDLPYFSDHTFKIRTRAASGFSEWSEPITVKTLEDPWRNCPEPVHVDWAGGEDWGKLDLAFDHNDTSESYFHSGQATGLPMTIDYGKTFQLDKFVYTPRQDNGGNGNVAEMKVETSVDGAHWKDHGVQKWDNSGADKMKPKTVELDGSAARYLRLTPVKSTGGFFSATELALYKVDKTEGQDTGSLKAPATVGEEDANHLPNCYGRENRGTGVTDWDSHITQSNADFNLNGAYDVYDMSFTMSKLEGGTKKEGKVAGTIGVVPEKTSVKQGETITVSVKVQNGKNVNAMGALVKYPVEDFEFVRDSIKYTKNIGDMEQHSGNYTFGEPTNSVNIALANRGDKALYNGTEAVATFQLKAKKDCEVNLDSQAWLVGPKQDFITADGSDLGPEVKELKQDAFNISLTNKGYPTDDGQNVKRLVQQNSYEGLFNDNENDREFEFKWFMGADQPFDLKVGLPANLTFELKEPRALKNVELFNGAKTSNGSINSLEAVITFTDGTKQEFKGDVFAENQPSYNFEISETNKAKKVAKVEIKPLTSTGTATGIENPENRMLTIGEINFNYVEGEEQLQEVAQKQFDITMTNDSLKTDDGTNVKKLVQDNSYATLFDDNENANGFEFKWDIAGNQVEGKLPEYVKLPTTMHFTLKDPMVLRDVQILNRLGGNGTVTSLEAVITYTDGSKSEFKGEDFAKRQDVYTLTADNTKEVKSIDITPLTSDGTATGYEGAAAKNRMLTLREINFHYAEGDQKPETEVNKADLQAKYDELKDKANDGYTEDSWNAFQTALGEAKKVLDNEKATQPEVDAALKALTDANAGLKKPEVPQVDKTALQAKYDELKDKANDGYTEDSWNTFQAALDSAKDVLANDKATQDQVNAALDTLTKANDGLVKEEVPPAEKPSKDELKDLVTKAEALDTTGKTPESVDALTKAIDAAKDVIANEDATKEDISAATDALKAAIDGLKDVEQGGGNQGGGDSGNQGGNTGGNQGGNTGSDSNGSGLPQTGDPVTMAVAGTGLIGSVTAALGAFFHRRRRDQ